MIVLLGSVTLSCQSELLSLRPPSRKVIDIKKVWVTGSLKLIRESEGAAERFDITLRGSPPRWHVLCYELNIERRCGSETPLPIATLPNTLHGPIWCPDVGVYFRADGPAGVRPESKALVVPTYNQSACPYGESYRATLHPMPFEEPCDLCETHVVDRSALELTEWIDL
jgi:hypothetical protein